MIHIDFNNNNCLPNVRPSYSRLGDNSKYQISKYRRNGVLD